MDHWLMALDIILGHHEHYNGGGYPRGISGDNIPLPGRIVAIADVYDALTTRRPYKEPFSHAKAVDIICSSAGVQFDPVLVEVFNKLEKNFQQLALGLQDRDVVGELGKKPGDAQRSLLADAS